MIQKNKLPNVSIIYKNEGEERKKEQEDIAQRVVEQGKSEKGRMGCHKAARESRHRSWNQPQISKPKRKGAKSDKG